MITVNFIRDKEVGIFARAKRIGKGTAAKTTIVPLDGGCADESGLHEGPCPSSEESTGERSPKRRR